jgi:hypothetical protein
MILTGTRANNVLALVLIGAQLWRQAASAAPYNFSVLVITRGFSPEGSAVLRPQPPTQPNARTKCSRFLSKLRVLRASVVNSLFPIHMLC